MLNAATKNKRLTSKSKRQGRFKSLNAFTLTPGRRQDTFKVSNAMADVHWPSIASSDEEGCMHFLRLVMNRFPSRWLVILQLIVIATLIALRVALLE